MKKMKQLKLANNRIFIWSLNKSEHNNSINKMSKTKKTSKKYAKISEKVTDPSYSEKKRSYRTDNWKESFNSKSL